LIFIYLLFFCSELHEHWHAVTEAHNSTPCISTIYPRVKVAVGTVSAS